MKKILIEKKQEENREEETEQIRVKLWEHRSTFTTKLGSSGKSQRTVLMVLSREKGTFINQRTAGAVVFLCVEKFYNGTEEKAEAIGAWEEGLKGVNTKYNVFIITGENNTSEKYTAALWNPRRPLTFWVSCEARKFGISSELIGIIKDARGKMK